MESESKVFSSNIVRCNNVSKNNLYDILNIVPVPPLPKKIKNTGDYPCGYVPKCDKTYLPKKKTGQRVKTVRNIRHAFERDVYSDLPVELEKQRNTLLRKIRYGFSKDEKTKELAINILKSDSPISKSAWQMVMNINPEAHKFSSQYILWKGNCIRVNGSKGGPQKFICNHNVGNVRHKTVAKSTTLNKKRQMLHNSLNIKFKPGPLSKKNILDASYQKYQFGELELAHLPKIGLEVQTSYGKPIAPLLDTFITKSFLQNNGLVTEKWAEFAVSVLGKTENEIASQDKIGEDCVTFELNYKCFQNRILMRHGGDIVNAWNHNLGTAVFIQEDDTVISSEVRKVMDNILNATEINLKQDEIYTGQDEPRVMRTDNANATTHLNNKSKRNGELRRLDVTVITLSETVDSDRSSCQKEYCALGCICDSIKCSYNLKRHCGRIDCMFNCKCDFSKYKYMNSIRVNECSDIIPGLINLDKTLGQKLAKEEQKFHQTVIVTDEKSILLKSERRNWKASKKYADFYSNMHLKSDRNMPNTLSIICPNLDCKSVEPWCMVHNLYKCFCKGRFTESGLEENKTNENENLNSKSNMNALDTIDREKVGTETTKHQELTTELPKTRLRRFRQEIRYDNHNEIDSSWKTDDICNTSLSARSARVEPYVGRKYDDSYYQNTNQKIMEMEKNDKQLYNKMLSLIQNDEEFDTTKTVKPFDKNKEDDQHLNIDTYIPTSLNELLSNVIEQRSCTKESSTRLPYKTKLVTWLEASYKKYKKIADQGLLKVSLDPPKAGKLCLYSWEFILSRYRERKNYFIISKHKPFRIFLSINLNNKYFDNCTNISDISLSDIDKYPITVKNLLTNATDLKESFCILCGLSYCWELIGSVTKVNENHDAPQEENQLDQLIYPEEKSPPQNTSNESYDIENMPFIIDNGTNENSPIEIDTGSLNLESCNKLPEDDSNEDSADISKWFVMKIENDFSEIQFFGKGFFVKYESVIQAINVSRASGKTVRLSSQKCSTNQNNPQFGIYAIPNTAVYCVFIGPYAKDERLGIEAIKKKSLTGTVAPQLCTRGAWLTTNKVDDLKVIDNPFQYFPPDCLNNDKMMTLENASSVEKIDTGDITKGTDIIPQPRKSKDTTKKIVRPIKIRKTNGFYHLTPSGCLKAIKSPEKNTSNKSLLLNTNVANLRSSLMSYSLPIKGGISMKQAPNDSKTVLSSLRPVAEIAPLVKICSNAINVSKEQRTRSDTGMFVLKPEEINKRLLEKNAIKKQVLTSQLRSEISLDIEKFLATTVVRTAPCEEVFVISDDENEITPSECTKPDSYKDVWIVCKNVSDLGWIAGKKYSEYLSFEFPGFKPSLFYPETEALKKISQILARKVYLPKHIDLQWQVLESDTNIKSIEKLDGKCLNSDYILTKKGLRHKHEVASTFVTSTMVESNSRSLLLKADKDISEEQSFEQKSNLMSNLEETSQTLEDESSFLWDEAVSKRDQLLASISNTSQEVRQELNDQLNCILLDTDD